MRNINILFLCATLATMNAVAAENDSARVVYQPEVHGTIRAKYEYQPQPSEGRFEVRNARFSLTGKVHPSVAYKAEIDLSDEGSIKMLDAYARYLMSKDFIFTIGQMRVPFGIDVHRSPCEQYFANRPFLSKQLGNIRDVGATIYYKMHAPFPITIEAGAFNGSGLTKQKDYWSKKVNYTAKLQLQVLPELNIVLGSQSLRPNDITINHYDVGSTLKIGRWTAEAEFLYKHYAHEAFKSVKAFDGFVNYDLPLRKCFSKVSFLGRYDMMTDHSDGTLDDTGKLKLTDSARQRVTGGITLSFLKPFIADIRINYEKYFYGKDAVIKVSEKDKLVVEFVARF